MVFVQTDLSSLEIPSLSDEDNALYFWLRIFFRLRYAMSYVPGNLNQNEGILLASPEIVNYSRDIEAGTVEPFLRFYYSVSVPTALTQLDLYLWMSKLQNSILQSANSYLEVIITEDEQESPRVVLEYETSGNRSLNDSSLIRLNNLSDDYFLYDIQSRLFFGKGDEELATQIYY